MTQRQKRFVEEFAKSGNATQSAIKAGYSKKTAYSIGEENLKKPVIKSELEKINKETRTETVASVLEIKEFFTEVARDKSQKMADRISAAKELAKIEGAYIEQVQISGGLKWEDYFKE